MSIITVFKDANSLIFGTDSRMMKHDYSGVDTDTEQKIFEIAPETYIACSGRKFASEFQVARARELAIELGTDIQAIGAALERDSFSILSVLLERLRQENDETTRQAVSGQIMLHGCTLVGWSGGKLGFVVHNYFVQADGTIKCISESYFAGARKVACVSGTPSNLLAQIASQFVCDMATWTDPMQEVFMRFMETVKESTPTIGGPWQVVRLDSAGSHWISEAPAAADLTGGTCSATVQFTAPIIKVTSGALVVDLAGSIPSPVGTITGTMVSHVSGGVITDAIISTAYSLMACGQYGSGGQNSYISQAGFVTSNGAAIQAFLGPAELSIRGLPSSNPGAGTKKFWYDPSDGNRVKFAA